MWFPRRAVDEDVMDKDQILLQKEAEVRTHKVCHFVLEWALDDAIASE